MHGFPIMRTVDVFVPDVRDRYPQSKAIDCHNKGHGAETRIARYLAENFRYNNQSLEDFAYCSQLMQSEAYGYALRDWKRKFNGKGKEACAGAIIWQVS
jgi:beta-mannosidase